MAEQADSTHPAAGTGGSVRVHYLDSLRVVAVLAVFLFHSLKPFTMGDWHILNAQGSMVATVILMVFLAPWGMPFFFLIAGAGSWFALQRRTARQFAAERVRRLLVPYLAGCALLTPPQLYFDWQFSSRFEGYHGTCLEYMFIDRWRGWNPTFFDWLGFHLWFLAFLFLASLLALPLFRWLKTPPGRRLVERLGNLVGRRGGLLVFILPLAAIQLGLRPLSPLDHSWSDLLYDLAFFVAGYLFYTDRRFLDAVKRDRWLTLATGFVGSLGLLVTVALGEAETLFFTPGTLAYNLFWALAVIAAWCWSLTMLNLGMRFLDSSHRWTRDGQEAVVPFYLLHQPVIIAIAFYVVQWQIGVTSKMLVIVLSSFPVTLGLYELIIRRVRLLRSLFGLKARIAEGQPTAGIWGQEDAAVTDEVGKSGYASEP